MNDFINFTVLYSTGLWNKKRYNGPVHEILKRRILRIHRKFKWVREYIKYSFLNPFKIMNITWTVSCLFNVQTSVLVSNLWTVIIWVIKRQFMKSLNFREICLKREFQGTSGITTIIEIKMTMLKCCNPHTPPHR